MYRFAFAIGDVINGKRMDNFLFIVFNFNFAKLRLAHKFFRFACVVGGPCESARPSNRAMVSFNWVSERVIRDKIQFTCGICCVVYRMALAFPFAWCMKIQWKNVYIEKVFVSPNESYLMKQRDTFCCACWTRTLVCAECVRACECVWVCVCLSHRACACVLQCSEARSV